MCVRQFTNHFGLVRSIKVLQAPSVEFQHYDQYEYDDGLLIDQAIKLLC